MTDRGVSFGLVPFDAGGGLESDLFPFNSGTAVLVSGPLVDMDVDAINGLTTYSYGPGTLDLMMSVDDGKGNTVEGAFAASTGSFSFTVCEGCDTLFDGGLANDFFIALGPGLFDAALAHALHVLPQTGGGSIDFGLEDITGGPDSVSRFAADHRGYMPLTIDTAPAPVPEPGLLLLMGLSGAAVALRRRRARP